MFRANTTSVNGTDMNTAKAVMEAALQQSAKASREVEYLRRVNKELLEEIEARDERIKAESNYNMQLQARVASLEQQLDHQSGSVKTRGNFSGCVSLTVSDGVQDAHQTQVFSSLSRPPSRPSSPRSDNLHTSQPQQPQQQEHIAPNSTHGALQAGSTSAERRQIATLQAEIELLHKREVELESACASSRADAETLRQQVLELEPLRRNISQLESQAAELEELRAQAVELEALREQVVELEELRQQVAELEPLREQVAELEPLRKQVAELGPLRKQAAELQPLHQYVQDQQRELNRLRKQAAELAPLRAQLVAAQDKAATAIEERRSIQADFAIYVRKYESLMAQKLEAEEQRDVLFNPNVDIAIVRRAMPAVNAAMVELEARLQATEVMLAGNRQEAESEAHAHQELRCNWRSKMDKLQAMLAEREAQLAQAQLAAAGVEAASLARVGSKRAASGARRGPGPVLEPACNGETSMQAPHAS